MTGSELFGREEDLGFLDAAWANPSVNVVTIVAWGGVGKSALINHWLGAMAAHHYGAAELVFGWSFYRQGTSGSTSSADTLIEAALNWFGDPIRESARRGRRREIGQTPGRRRTLLILDGLEPLQNPPGPQEGRLREPSLQAFLRELAAFNAALRDFNEAAGSRSSRSRARFSAPPRPGTPLQRCWCQAASRSRR